MAGLWTLVVLFWTWTPPCLPSGVTFIGSPRECKKAHFVPGYNLGGDGFDIVTMERKGASVIDTETWKLGNGMCRLYKNSYMNEKQKVPVSVVNWRVLPQCSLKINSVVYNSAETFANASTSAVTNDWRNGLNLPAVPADAFSPVYGGSRSKECSFAIQKSKNDRYTFFRHSISCNVYSYKLALNSPLSHEFESAVNSLPSYSNKTESQYRSLIDTYGTHYITRVFLGGEIKAVTAIGTCKATLRGLSATEISDCLLVEASADFAHPKSVRTMKEFCDAKKKKLSVPSFSRMFNERSTEVTGGNIDGADILFKSQSNPAVYKRWIDSLKTTTGVVRYSLKPLHAILPYAHLARAGLKQEVENYIKRNAVLKKCSESCKIGQRSSKRDPCACVCHENPNLKYNCCPAAYGLATLTVFKLYAKDLYGDILTHTDGWVEVKYGNQKMRTAAIDNNNNPRWPETFHFGPIQLSDTKLNFTVYDQDMLSTEQLGRCSIDLRQGNVSGSCMFKHGTFFYSYAVNCAPSLGGLQCQNYIPTPDVGFLTASSDSRKWGVIGKSGRMLEDVGWMDDNKM
ncbi:perforin-1-like [Brachyistius frenatus]|uniref:perforin-1-like n=1 Tax=Brachyistius frenatus TaxID=100188 RepID=UPI0037E88561